MVEKKPTLEEQGLDIRPHPKQPVQPRAKPMEVLCLGLSRTGTMSLYVALNKLDLNCYHMMEAGRNNANGSIKRWKEAVEAKYFGGTEPKLETAQDFDQLLWRYQAISDIPCVLFCDELLEAYPNAKVILTERGEDGWVRSVQNSFYTILSWKIWSFVQIIDWVHARHYIPLLHYPLQVWTGGDEYNLNKLRQGYRAHNAHIRSIVPKDKLLIYHASQGWQPLCDFLGKPVPNEPMPKVNEGMWVADLHKFLVKMDITMGMIRWLRLISPVAVVAGGWLAYQTYVQTAEIAK